MTLMKSIKLILLATAVLAIASLAVGTTMQAQAKFIDNRHSHTSIGDEIGEIKGNEAVVQNTDESHTNTNFNYNRGDTFEERYKENTHDKGGNSDKGEEETEP